ncbi:MAG: hypothetical protein LBU27_05745 [Candidatus Peribacteria bacterium]|jgi:hypothetical protein|nr:hypothetical protein [Candidatus Peribacteria bacterium]
MIEIKDGLFGRDINLKSSVYIKVFGEVPRNEGYECKNKHCTKKYYALSEIEKENLKECLLCGRQLEKVYDEEILQIEWEKRSEKKGYIEKLAWKNQELI